MPELWLRFVIEQVPGSKTFSRSLWDRLLPGGEVENKSCATKKGKTARHKVLAVSEPIAPKEKTDESN